MRILRLRAYYDPEKTAGIHLDHDLCEAFSKEKIHYISYTPMPTRGITDEVRKIYRTRRKERKYNGYVHIYRFKMIKEGSNPIQRAIRYLLCSIIEYYYGIHEKNIDVVYSSSTPPTQGMLSALVAKRLSKKYGRKVPFVYNLQDIFPDSLVNVGLTKKGNWLWKIGRKIEDYTYKSADKIIVISEGFKRNIISKGVPEKKIFVVSNWVDLNSIKPVKKKDNKLFDELKIDRSKFIVLYAGNIGEAQGVDVILESAKQLESYKDIQFVIFGGGVKYEETLNKIKKQKNSNITISKLLPEERVSEVYSMGDVALITCKPGTGNAALPSKTWSIMACNKPIIASFDMKSELSEVINQSGAGKCVEAGNPSALANAIFDYYSTSYREKEESIRQYVIDSASKHNCTKRYIEILSSYK